MKSHYKKFNKWKFITMRRENLQNSITMINIPVEFNKSLLLKLIIKKIK